VLAVYDTASRGPTSRRGQPRVKFRLEPRTPVSFHAETDQDAANLADWLIRRLGFQPLAPRSQWEEWRLKSRSGLALCLIFRSGAVLCQGQRARELARFLADVAGLPAEEVER
jgi:hypothetical protein